MTICPIALVVGCEKCPAFSFCPLTTILGDQQEEENTIDSANKVWEESFPPGKNETEEKIRLTKDERLARIKESAEKKSAHDNESW